MDALVIGGRLFTLEGAERPHHELVDRMIEGSTFLNRDGVIIYASLYLADLLDTPLLQFIRGFPGWLRVWRCDWPGDFGASDAAKLRCGF